MGVLVAIIAAGIFALWTPAWRWLSSRPWESNQKSAVNFGAFSPKGGYFLLEEEGKVNGRWYTAVRAISVLDNTTKIPMKLREASNVAAARSAALAALPQPALAALGLSAPAPAAFVPAGPAGAHRFKLTVNGLLTELTLVEKVADSSPVCGGPSKMFELDARNRYGRRGLQDDDHVPLSRACATGYAMTGVFVQGDRVAVIVKVTAKPRLSRGFRFIAVTGKLGATTP